MLNRRKFISQATLAAGSLLVSSKFAGANDLSKGIQNLTILHTNDVHSRIDPFPMNGSANQGLGGVAARSHLINQIRKDEENVLLLDAGDIFQGTPYFNVFNGEPELKAMTAMGYDATTIGNHEFDSGMENLALQLNRHAAFPMIVSNYDFSSTPMENNFLPYKIFKKGNLKIGVLGAGIELKGLVAENLYGNTRYLHPVEKINEYANELKRKGCDFIICLSHLGYKYDYNKMSDMVLAKETENIDLIIGGHTHSFLPEPVLMRNKKHKEVLINQVGWAGIQLGRLDFEFQNTGHKNLMSAGNILVTKKNGI